MGNTQLFPEVTGVTFECMFQSSAINSACLFQLEPELLKLQLPGLSDWACKQMEKAISRRSRSLLHIISKLSGQTDGRMPKSMS